MSGTTSFAREARAFTAATFIASLIALALTSSAPLKIYGNPSTSGCNSSLTSKRDGLNFPENKFYKKYGNK